MSVSLTLILVSTALQVISNGSYLSFKTESSWGVLNETNFCKSLITFPVITVVDFMPQKEKNNKRKIKTWRAQGMA